MKRVKRLKSDDNSISEEDKPKNSIGMEEEKLDQSERNKKDTG